MHSIAVIGDYESICGFLAVGFQTFPVETVEQARQTLKLLVNSNHGIIFITEPFMEKLQVDCNRYNESVVPCIVPIPTSSGGTGLGEALLRRYVERAVGSDTIQ